MISSAVPRAGLHRAPPLPDPERPRIVIATE